MNQPFTIQNRRNLSGFDSLFDIVELEDYSLAPLRKRMFYETEIAVISTGDEEKNAELGIMLKEKGSRAGDLPGRKTVT